MPTAVPCSPSRDLELAILTARKPQLTPALDKLAGSECSLLLTALLASHLDLRGEAEHLALALLADSDADEVAESIEWELRAARSAKSSWASLRGYFLATARKVAR